MPLISLAAALLLAAASSALPAAAEEFRPALSAAAGITPPAASPPVLAQPGAPEDYPLIKSRTVSFNSAWYVKAEGGKIYLKPNFERTGRDGPWQELAAPAAAGRIAELSADGDNLMAVSEAGRVFYMKFSTRKWREKIGKPFGSALYLPENRGWAVSHLGPETGNYYEDPDGRQIRNKEGVSTLYVLSKDGLRLSYTDPWLRPGFDYHIDMPLRGRFAAENVSASASTIFLIGRGGRMFTRLADFDTMGCDPLFSYSFTPAAKPGVIRLPGEDWREQPRINGRVTRNIAIIQNGRGNAARELRVEGLDAEDNAGYYTKAIYADAWSFVRTGRAAAGPFLTGQEEAGPAIDGDYRLEYRRLPEGARLRGFSPLNRRAEIVLPGLESAPLVFHTRETFLPNRPGGNRHLFGTIEVPQALLSSPAAAGLIKALGGNFREVWVKVEGDTARLRDSHLGGLGAVASGYFQDYGER